MLLCAVVCCWGLFFLLTWVWDGMRTLNFILGAQRQGGPSSVIRPEVSRVSRGKSDSTLAPYSPRLGFRY